jgi:hypothetical protein
MARKKQVDYQEIQETPLDQIIGEASEEEKPDDETIEASSDAEGNEVEVPEEEVEEEIEFDPTQFAADLEKKLGDKFTQISEDTAKKIMEDAMKKAPPQEAAKEEPLMSPWQKEGRTPKDYEEIADWAMEKNRILSERKSAADTAKSQEQTKAQEDYNKAQIDNFNKYTAGQLNDLRTAGKIPSVKNPNNPDDPGVAAERELLEIMLEVNQERVKTGELPIYSIKEIFYEHLPEDEDIEEPVQQVAGADAPVSAGRMPVGGEDKEISYTEIHKKPLTQIIMEGLRGKSQ